DVRPDARLTAKTKTGESLTAQQRPKLAFPFRHVPSEFSGAKVRQFRTPFCRFATSSPTRGGRRETRCSIQPYFSGFPYHIRPPLWRKLVRRTGRGHD